jgi:hypothetical protein
MESFSDLFKVYFLFNILLVTLSAPLLANNHIINMGLLNVITPVILAALPRGGNIFGRLALDAPFLIVSSFISLGVIFGASMINERFEQDFKNYGKTTESTRNVLGLRAVGLLIGFLVSYFIFGKRMYKHYNSI